MRTTRRLRFAYGVAVMGVVLTFNAAAFLAWRLLFSQVPLPYGLFLVNTLAAGGMVVAGSMIERRRLADDSSAIAARLGARALDASSALLTLLERRVVDIVQEMALAAHLPIPRLHVLDHEPSINALAVGLNPQDAALIVTRGAIERLDRDEIQGVVAHEVAHLASGDVAVHAQLGSMNFGLELMAAAGRRVLDAAFAANNRERDRVPRIGLGMVTVLPGALLLAMGWPGHLAARLLTAAVGHKREFHADALAVRLMRQPQGLGNALRKISWMAIHEPTSARLGAEACPVSLSHALFHSGGQAQGRSGRWLAVHPDLSARIERLPAVAAAPMPAQRAVRDQDSLSLDRNRAAVWLASSALPALACSAESSPGTWLPGHTGAVAARLAAQARSDDLAALVVATHRSESAAAMAALLVVGGAVDAEIWPLRWRAAIAHQAQLAVRLRRLGPQAIEGLRWPLLELCGAAIKPLAMPWREDLLRMLRGQIEIDQRVTMAEWIYYMLLRARLLPANVRSWGGDEASANPAEAVRWVMTLLSRCIGEPDLRAQRVSNQIIQSLGLSRIGQSHPPLDVGGLQAVVASLGQLPALQRPSLLRQFVQFLPPEAPIETRDFLRILALIIHCPMPVFPAVAMMAPDTSSMPSGMIPSAGTRSAAVKAA